MATQFLDYKIPLSLIKKTTKFVAYHVSARMWFREILKWLHVPFYDCSCPNDSTGQPVQAIDIGEGGVELQRFNGTEWVEIPIDNSTPAGFTGEIVAVEGTYEFTNGVLTTFTPA